MAEVAHGVNCPKCGTLNAVAGNKADQVLSGTCASCGATLQVPNPSYQPPLKNAAEIGKFEVSLKNPDGSLGTVSVTGYHLTPTVTNVKTLVPDAQLYGNDAQPAPPPGK